MISSHLTYPLPSFMLHDIFLVLGAELQKGLEDAEDLDKSQLPGR